MIDIYADAIQATLEHDNIRRSWLAGGDHDGVPLHGLLFRTCPHLGCCLTECKSGMCDGTETQSEAQSIIDDLKNDDLIPVNQWDLESQWDDADIKSRTKMLEQFAMYNRELDELFDREPADIIED